MLFFQISGSYGRFLHITIGHFLMPVRKLFSGPSQAICRHRSQVWKNLLRIPQHNCRTFFDLLFISIHFKRYLDRPNWTFFSALGRKNVYCLGVVKIYPEIYCFVVVGRRSDFFTLTALRTNVLWPESLYREMSNNNTSKSRIAPRIFDFFFETL